MKGGELQEAREHWSRGAMKAKVSHGRERGVVAAAGNRWRRPGRSSGRRRRRIKEALQENGPAYGPGCCC